jgi:hypothetical protein
VRHPKASHSSIKSEKGYKIREGNDKEMVHVVDDGVGVDVDVDVDVDAVLLIVVLVFALTLSSRRRRV